MRELGDFILDRPLGRGASAQVFLAYRKMEPSERLALKVFHPAFWDREELRRRAMSEFRAISSLSHPNIVRVLEACWDSEPPAVAFEYIEGSSLEQFLPQLPLALPEVAVLVMLEVLAALEHAHQNGIIHRDMKPANILIGSLGRVLVTDFGLAKIADVSQLTLSGTILGSPDFMAPEQARGDASTPQSDLFAAAAILYYLVTGTRPFSRHSPLATLVAVTQAEPEPPQLRNPKLAPELARIVLKGLAKKPEERFACASQFRVELAAYLRQHRLDGQDFAFSSWIKDPSGVCLHALRTKAAALTGLAEGRLEAREWSAFLETLSHLSAIAPETPELQRLMLSYEGERRRARARGLWTTGAVSTLCVAALTAGAVRLGRLLPGPPPPVARDRLATTLAAPVDPPPFVATEPALPKPARIAPHPRKKTSRIQFDVPDTVTVYWNGVAIDRSRPLGRQPLGSYQLRLEKPGAQPIEQTIVVDSTEPTVIRVR